MSTWGDVASTIAKAAPILGNLIPGVGTVAGVGVGAVASIVASALGTSPDPDSIMDALKNDPDALAKVRQAELDNQKDLAQIAMQREQNQLAAQTAQQAQQLGDIQSARQFATQNNDHTARNLAYLYTFALFLTIAAHLGILVAKVEIEPLAMSLISTLEGVLVTMAVKTSEVFTGGSASADRLADHFAQFATSPGSVTSPTGTTTTVQTTSAPQTITVTPEYKGGS